MNFFALLIVDSDCTQVCSHQSLGRVIGRSWFKFRLICLKLFSVEMLEFEAITSRSVKMFT